MKSKRISLPPEERKNEILDSAEKLFFSKGYNNVTVTDIIKNLGIVKGTFYYYFDNKKEVKDILIKRYVDREVNKLNEILDSDKDILNKLLEIILALINYINEEEKVTNNMYMTNPEIYQQITLKRMETFEPIIKRIIDEGIQEEVFNPKYYDETQSLLLINLIQTIPLIHYTAENMTEEKEILSITATLRNLEFMLGAKEGTFDFIRKALILRIEQKNNN